MMSALMGNQPGAVANDDGKWWSPRRFALLLGILIIAVFPDVLTGSHTFFFKDFSNFAYPVAQYHRDCFWRGEIPLWNPLSNCGLPFLAQWNTMTLYPPSLFYLLLPLEWSLGVFCLLHLFLAGLGMYFLAYRWTGHRFAAAVAGVAFTFSGLTIDFLMWPSHIATLCWTPWLMLTVERAWREGGRRVYHAALVGVLQMLAGAPETILLTWVLLTTMWLCQLGQGRSARPPMLGRFLLVVLLVAGLAAAQLLPFLDLLAHSDRHANFGNSQWAMPGWGWANFFIPLFFNVQGGQGVLLQYDQYFTSSYYLGIGVLGLAVHAAWQVRQPRVWFLTAVALLCLILALGDNGHLYAWLRRGIPALGFMRYPVKFVFLPVLIIPLLAAYAVQRLDARFSSNPARDRKTLAVIALGFLGIMALLLWFITLIPANPPPDNQWDLAWPSALSRAGLLVMSWVLIFLAGRPNRVTSPWKLSLGLLLLIWFDFVTHTPRQNPTVMTGVYAIDLIRSQIKLPTLPVAGETRAMLRRTTDLRLHFSSSDTPENEVLQKRLGSFANCNLLDHLPKVDGFFSLYPQPVINNVASLFYFAPGGDLPRLADFLGVSMVSAPDGLLEWVARPTALPLATAGQQPRFAEPRETLQGLTRPDFDSRKVVYLPPAVKSAVGIAASSAARIVARRYTSHRIEIEVEARGSALLVLAQCNYHLWRAYVDDQPVPLWTANFAFQALPVPDGKHEVRLVYEDRPFRVGLAISALTLLLGLGLFWRSQNAAS